MEVDEVDYSEILGLRALNAAVCFSARGVYFDCALVETLIVESLDLFRAH